MNQLVRATAALAMFITSAAIAQSDGKINLSGQVLAPAACRVDPASIRHPEAFKLTCVTDSRGVIQTPVHRVSVEPVSVPPDSVQQFTGDTTTYVVQISYL